MMYEDVNGVMHPEPANPLKPVDDVTGVAYSKHIVGLTRVATLGPIDDDETIEAALASFGL
jgi:hypothetical protein